MTGAATQRLARFFGPKPIVIKALNMSPWLLLGAR